MESGTIKRSLLGSNFADIINILLSFVDENQYIRWEDELLAQAVYSAISLRSSDFLIFPSM